MYYVLFQFVIVYIKIFAIHNMYHIINHFIDKTILYMLAASQCKDKLLKLHSTMNLTANQI